SNLRKRFGKDITGAAVYASATSELYFGSWPKALLAAGLDPDEVIRRQRVSKIARFAAVPHQKEYLKHLERSQRVIGKAPPRPVDETVKSELMPVIERAMKRFDDEDQPLVTNIIKAILEGSETATKIQQFVEADLADVQRVLSQLKSDSKLKAF